MPKIFQSKVNYHCMLLDIVIFLAGLALLSWSADRFVYGASAIARNLGVAPMIIGLTIVAMGSSAPEIMIAATSSMQGNPDTAIGNAIGSNITNIALVLGMTALLKPLTVSSTLVRREMPVVMAVSLLAAYLLADLYLSFSEGALLMVIFFLTIGGLTWVSLKADKRDPYSVESADEIPTGVPTSKALLWLAIGMVLLPVSAQYMVDSAVSIAQYFGISDLVIGLTIIAIGTSLPELAACIAGVLKNEDDMVLGNIVGSNIFNILAVLAMPGLIAPGSIDADAAGRDIYVMLGLTLLLLVFCFNFRGKRYILRWQGALLLTGFIAYQLCLFV